MLNLDDSSTRSGVREKSGRRHELQPEFSRIPLRSVRRAGGGLVNNPG